MNDVAPILLESVQKCFDKWFYTDREVKEIYKKVRKGTATFKEMKRFSERAGTILVESLKATFSADKLPDGKLYQNIAEKVITPMLEQNHGLINEVCGYVADDLNKAARIGTKAVTAVFNADKAETVAQIAANCGGIKPGNKAAQLVENATMSMVDDFIQANLEFQKKLGLVPQIQRIYHGGKNRCEFCASLQYTGEYNGPSMPSEIFRRHRDCRCTLIYKPQKGPYQDPWSKAEKDDYQKLVTEQRKYLTELDKMSAGERRFERNAKARAQRRSQYSGGTIKISSPGSTKSYRKSLKAISEGKAGLDKRRKAILGKIPEESSAIRLGKNSITERDLAYLSAATDNEFALFRSKTEDILIRGNNRTCNPPEELGDEILDKRYEWIAHTHVDRGPLIPSTDDKNTLRRLKQKESKIIGVDGQVKEFSIEN